MEYEENDDQEIYKQQQPDDEEGEDGDPDNLGFGVDQVMDKYEDQLDQDDIDEQQALVNINQKLREELTKTFEGYVTMLAKCDTLRKEKLDLQYRIRDLEGEEAYQAYHASQKKIEYLTFNLKALEQNLKETNENYCKIIDRLKSDLAEERREKLMILQEFDAYRAQQEGMPFEREPKELTTINLTVDTLLPALNFISGQVYTELAQLEREKATEDK